MQGSIRAIRFVGGPWHNRIEDVMVANQVELRLVTKQNQIGANGLPEAVVRKERYCLASYCTGLGTLYYQYVHSSLIHRGRTCPSTYREVLPAMRLNCRLLEQRLLEAVRKTKLQGPIHAEQ